jgi:hypothetical protein
MEESIDVKPGESPGAYHYQTLRIAGCKMDVGDPYSLKCAAKRMIEEATELALECGCTPAEVLVHVTDALCNEAKKRGTGQYPSMQRGIAFPHAGNVSVEIVDVEICVDLIRFLLAQRTRGDVDQQKLDKLELLRHRVLSNDFAIVDNRIYKKERP